MILDYWMELYNKLRNDGEFLKADELREMIRRMGYEIKRTKIGYEVIKIYV